MSNVSSSSSSVDGLVSGLKTTELIAQLMAVEARPQTMMKIRQVGFQSQITAFESVRSKLSSLRLGAQALIGENDWTPVLATSSNDAVATVSGATGGSVGSISFHVDQLASSHSLTSSGTVATTTAVVTSSPLSITVGGDTRTIAVGGGSLQEVVNAINSEAGFKLSAAAVKVGDGAYRLQLSSTTSGAAGQITMGPGQFSGVGGSWLLTSAARDAQVTVGSGADAYTITSAGNTLEGVLPGVSINLLQQGQSVTVSSTRDGAELADKVDTMVTAMNTVLAEIAAQTKYDPTAKTGSPLTGDSTVRDVQRRLVEAISNPVGLAYPDTYGLSINRDGTVAFDRTKFLAAYAADPTTTQQFFESADPEGLATRVSAAVDTAVNSTNGSLVTVLRGRRQTVADLDTQIGAYQLRLDKREAALKRIYSNLETTLGNLQNQGTWLSGQLASLSS